MAGDIMANEKVAIFDTTLRDGEQTAGAGMTTQEKLELGKQLERLGVDIIEAGFAASSPGDFEAVATLAKELQGPIVASLARANPNDIDMAWEAIKSASKPRIHVFLSSSDIHIMHQLRRNREEVMDMAVTMVARARGYCEDVEFSPMDATRTEPAYLYAMLEAVIKAGATTINIPDTVGYSIPSEFSLLIKGVKENVSNISNAIISVHCHNDLGLGVANSLAAVQAGARQVEGCINGLGERAGNASLEEIIMAIDTRKDFLKVYTDINTSQLYRTSRMVSDISGFPIQPNKAIVGQNAFRHASGIHQDGVLKERQTYEIMDPLTIGWPSGNGVVLGKLSGRAGLRSRLEELGYKLEKNELDLAFESFKALADKKREISDRDLEALMSEHLRADVEQYSYALDQVQVACGDHEIPTATVRLIGPNNEVYVDACTGTGPVDAVYKAINRIIGVSNTLCEFTVNSITEGVDALGEVTIRIQNKDRIYVGRASDTDIIVASAKAYMNALNRLITLEAAGKQSLTGIPNP
jgi:2-isopropylmalate synthase